MLLSAGGSLVWREDGLCALSSYQCEPLWEKRGGILRRVPRSNIPVEC